MIKYIDGDATAPQGDGKKVIVHCCNDLGAWGAGFVLAISRRWKSPERYYKALIQETAPEDRLGIVQYCTVENKLVVANLIGQHGIGGGEDGVPPIRYEAIRRGLKDINTYCIVHDATMHAPKFGSDLAGGDWNVIEQIINEEITVPVTIYIYKP